jgi:hypothetical protein
MTNAHFYSGAMILLYFGGTLLALAVQYFSVRGARGARDDVNTIPRSSVRGGLGAAPHDSRDEGVLEPRETTRAAA